MELGECVKDGKMSAGQSTKADWLEIGRDNPYSLHCIFSAHSVSFNGRFRYTCSSLLLIGRLLRMIELTAHC